jgi:cell division protein FtsQ
VWHNVRQLNLVASMLYALAAGVLVACATLWMIGRPMFTLRAIEIDGDVAHVNVPTVRASLAGHLQGNFFTDNLDVARVAFESMPWVRRAGVRRIWPDRLAVTLEEYKPVATWGNDQLVSAEGELFTANQGELDQDDLPALSGPEGSAKDVLAKYYEFMHWFAPIGVKPVEVTLSPRYAWSVKFSDGMSVELGRERDEETLMKRSNRLVSAWSEVTHRWGEQIESVDLRYPNGFAVQVAGVRFIPDQAAGASKK